MSLAIRFAAPALPLSETDITSQIRSLMESRGWRAIRMQRTIVPGQFSTCEPGMADFLFLYFLPNPHNYAVTLALWVELKKPRARMACRCLQNRGTRKRCTFCDQKAWQTRERARGGVVWSGVDDLGWFIEQYDREFGWLHSGDMARGQLDLLASVKG